ncbi:MAG: cell division protein FtsH, partial [Rhizobiaceae bacterium]
WIAIAEGLLEYETLSGEEIKQIIAGEKPSRDMGDDSPNARASAVPKTGTKPRKKGGEPGMEPQPQG